MRYLKQNNSQKVEWAGGGGSGFMGVQFQFYKMKMFWRSSSQQCKLLTTPLYPQKQRRWQILCYMICFLSFVQHNKELGRETRRSGPTSQLLFKLNFLYIHRTFFFPLLQRLIQILQPGTTTSMTFPYQLHPCFCPGRSTVLWSQATGIPNQPSPFVNLYPSKLFNCPEVQFPHR